MAEPKQNKQTKLWEFVFDYYEDGKRKQVRRRGFKSKRDANDVLIDLQKEVQENEYIQSDKTTVATFFADWLEKVRKLEVEETTFYNNELYLKNHIGPRIGNEKIQQLNLKTCQNLVNEMNNAGYARNTIDRVITMAKKALDYAIKCKIIKENPMRVVTLPKRKKINMPFWTLEQANYFLNFTKNRRFYCAYALALLTGMRQGEILGLRWKDIDFNKNVITINQTLTHYGKKLKDGAKTKSSTGRPISMPNYLVEILQKQYASYKELKESLGNECLDTDLVIYNLKDCGSVFPGNFVKRYIADVKRSKLPHIPFHSLRHTHATMLIEKNVNVKIIAERLGHSKVGITLDTYSHVIPSMQQEVADKIDEMITL